jgi:hypothetical protein
MDPRTLRPFRLVASGIVAAGLLVSCDSPSLKETGRSELSPPAQPPASENAAGANLPATVPRAEISLDPEELSPALPSDASHAKDAAAEAAAVLSGDGLSHVLPPGDELEPELRVFRNSEGALVVEGALSSRFQRDEIIEALSEAFTGTRVEDRLEVDYDRIAVGWGNSVAFQFLIPFFKTIENGFVEYEQGVISLSGKGSRTDADFFQHLAIDVFTGPYSRDIMNQISD